MHITQSTIHKKSFSDDEVGKVLPWLRQAGKAGSLSDWCSRQILLQDCDCNLHITQSTFHKKYFQIRSRKCTALFEPGRQAGKAGSLSDGVPDKYFYRIVTVMYTLHCPLFTKKFFQIWSRKCTALFEAGRQARQAACQMVSPTNTYTAL